MELQDLGGFCLLASLLLFGVRRLPAQTHHVTF